MRRMTIEERWMLWFPRCQDPMVQVWWLSIEWKLKLVRQPSSISIFVIRLVNCWNALWSRLHRFVDCVMKLLLWCQPLANPMKLHYVGYNLITHLRYQSLIELPLRHLLSLGMQMENKVKKEMRIFFWSF